MECRAQQCRLCVAAARADRQGAGSAAEWNVENVFEELDSPNEWYRLRVISIATGILT